MPALPKSPPLSPPLKRAANLALICGWSYLITLLALFGVHADTPPWLRVGLLDISVLFGLVGAAELYWRHKLLRTREARWVRVLAINEVVGTLVLIWNLAWLYGVPEKALVPLISEQSRKSLTAITQLTGQPITDAVLESSLHTAKFLTLYGVGGLIFLSQIWIIVRYLRLARAVEQASAVPPLLA
jgi:hypothetical protein